MNNTSSSNTNNNLYNICSLEHCYTNLFALTDITGIKWLKLKVKDKAKTPNSNAKQSKSSSSKSKKKNKSYNNDEDEDDDENDDDNSDDDEDEDDEDNDDENEHPNDPTPTTNGGDGGVAGAGADNAADDSARLQSPYLHSTSVNDPILVTHSKCLNEDILCSWKRVAVSAATATANTSFNSSSQNKSAKPGEASAPAADVEFKKELWIFWFEREEPPNLRTLISKDLTVVDQSSTAGQTNSNMSQHDSATGSNLLALANSSHNGLPYECRSMLFKALHNLIEKSLLEKGYARLGKWFVMPYNLNSINYSIYNFNLGKNTQPAAAAPPPPPPPPPASGSARLSSKLPAATSNNGKLNFLIDESNHVSYAFNFFLHGASRVCTSVDVKMHKPIRLVNQLDLVRMRTSLRKYFFHSAARKKSSWRKKGHKRRRFMGLSVILAPYGIAARLLGYLSNDSNESKLTCDEWRQFYPVKLLPNMPNVLVVGIDKNRVKLFYPNCFVYVVMDSPLDQGDDDERLNEPNLSRTSSVESLLSSSSSVSGASAAGLGHFHLNSDDELTSCSSSGESSRSSGSSPGGCSSDDSLSLGGSSLDGTGLGTSDDDGNDDKDDDDDDTDTAEDDVADEPGAANFNSDDGTNSDDDDENEPDVLLNNDEGKSTAKNREMDSLDLTIDSVARNFGTDKTFDLSPNNDRNTTANNKSVLSVSLGSPLSVTEISSPSSIHHHSPSNHASPSTRRSSITASPAAGKQSLKRMKSFTTQRSTSNLEQQQQQPPPQQPPSVAANNSLNKKRKKNLESSSSDLSLNSSLVQLNQTGIGIQSMPSNNKQVKINPTATVNSGAVDKTATQSTAKAAENWKFGGESKKKRVNVQRRGKRSGRGKKAPSRPELINVGQLVEQQLRTMGSKSKKTSRKTMHCCKYKYNVYKTLNNQVRLKHKKYELMNENLPLAFDLLDKAAISSCVNPMCNSNSINVDCIRCSILNEHSIKLTNVKPKCTCCDVAVDVSGTESAQKNPLTSKDLSANFSSTLLSLLKTESVSGNQRTNVYNVGTRFAQPFHRRKCHFDHSISHTGAAAATAADKFSVCVVKSTQPKLSGSKCKSIRIRNDCVINTDDDESEHNNDDFDDEDDADDDDYETNESDDDNEPNDIHNKKAHARLSTNREEYDELAANELGSEQSSTGCPSPGVLANGHRHDQDDDDELRDDHHQSAELSQLSDVSSVKLDDQALNYQYFVRDEDDMSLFESDIEKRPKIKQPAKSSSSSSSSTSADSSRSSGSSSSSSSSSSSGSTSDEASDHDDDDDNDDRGRVDPVPARQCLSNLTNTTAANKPTSCIPIVSKTTTPAYLDYMYQIENREQRPDEEHNDHDSDRDDAEEDRSFDNLYLCEQFDVNQAQTAVTVPPTTINLPPSIKSSQMTPPKSVESLQLSTMSVAGPTTTQAQSLANTSATTPHILPVSYDDLNNIFEEESSADEQQQQQQQPSLQPTCVQPPATATTTNTTLQQINTIQTSLSVVMTPPSHETIVKSCQMVHSNLALNEENDLLLTCVPDEPSKHHFNGSLNAPEMSSKCILFNDLNTILNNANRQLSLTDMILDTSLFSIPKLNNNLADNLNKYKSVKLSLTTTAQLKWKFKKSESDVPMKQAQQSHQPASVRANRRVSKRARQRRRRMLKRRRVYLARVKKQQLATPGGKLISQLGIKPLDKLRAQLDESKLKKSNIDSPAYFLNGACLSLNLSDTLLNSFRDVNFDSCTLCVCTNNNIKGIDYPIYICNDIFDTDETSLNIHSCNTNNNNNAAPAPSYTNCTCGFSSIVNRALVSRLAHTVRLDNLIQLLNRLKLNLAERNELLSYSNLVGLLDKLTEARVKSKQLCILDTTNMGGLFSEDYVDILMLTQPHSLLAHLSPTGGKLLVNTSLITRKFLNSILFRENYLWKRSVSHVGCGKSEPAQPADEQNYNLTDAKLVRKQRGHYELVNLNVLDLFDLKYSNPMLSLQESYDLFYSAGSSLKQPERECVDFFSQLIGCAKRNTNNAANNHRSLSYRKLKRKLDLFDLNQFDDNSVCLNTLKRLGRSSSSSSPSKFSARNGANQSPPEQSSSSFLLHEWLYEKKEIKSNLELTKSLKLIQPLLEETVQKKYTTSRMWESFQGPLTWQHFCRLAFRDGSSAQNRHNHHSAGSSTSGVSSTSTSGGGGQTASTGQTQAQQTNQNHNCYEPEPIPALLVSSGEKDWLTISPYSIKFWDKLNLEPYSKHKNIAYVCIVPDFDYSDSSDTNGTADSFNDLNECETIRQSVKDYFKELSSVYELCRLGLHRPALRIAPEQGLVRVALETRNKSRQSTSTPASKVTVDDWFTNVQKNPSTRTLGRHLKSYARCFKSLAIKIANGHTSTLTSTIDASIFATTKSKTPATTSFQSTIVPTVSNINLDRSIYEEAKVVKHEPTSVTSGTVTSQTISSTPSLSNLLNQPIGGDLLLGQNEFSHPSPIDFASTGQTSNSSQQQAQILTNFSNVDEKSNAPDPMVGSLHHQQQLQHSQQQQTLNSLASSSNLTQISQLTANITSPPALFVYIVDPFDFYLYNTHLKRSEKSTADSDTEPEDPAAAADEQKEPPPQLDEHDLKRLRTLGLYKAYLEFYNNLPELFKYSTQFQIIPLGLCADLQTQSTSLYVQSMTMNRRLNNSNYSSYYSSGFGTSWSDLDMDYKLSVLKNQAFNVFSLSKRYFMSPAHNYYLALHQQQNNPSRPKTLTCFGPAAYEEKFLNENLMNSAIGVNKPLSSFSQMRTWQFYSPAYILAPSTITTSAVSLAASNLFYKNPDFLVARSAANPTSSTSNTNGMGECISLLPHFVQLNMSNSHYGFLNSNNSYNYNLNELIAQQQQLLQPGSSGSLLNSTSGSLSNLSMAGSASASVGGASGTGSAQLGQSASMSNISGAGTTSSSSNYSNYLTSQPHQQQCNVLYVGYCLSEDQRYLLTSCCDENGELIESTSIHIEVDERFRRREYHVRRIGLRKLWEFIIVVISQTCKPWRLVIGRLGRMGPSELRGWACLLSKKNLQRYCQQLKETCESCNVLGNLEMPCILSACLISMETCDTICVYPEAYSREDKIAAAALTGQTQLLSNHAAQAHGVSCTHILTFPASAIIQTQANSLLGVGSSMKDGDAVNKAGMGAGGHGIIDDNDFLDFFKFEDDEMTELLNDNMNDKVLNESGAANEAEQMKEKHESLLNQEEMAHLDQQPLAVGYYVSTARCGLLPKWLRGDVSQDRNFHTFKATLHIHNRYALENDELIMKTENSHKLDSSVTYEVLRYVLERYNALSWLNIDPLIQDRKSCLPIHHSILLQMYYAFKKYI